MIAKNNYILLKDAETSSVIEVDEKLPYYEVVCVPSGLVDLKVGSKVIPNGRISKKIDINGQQIYYIKYDDIVAVLEDVDV